MHGLTVVRGTRAILSGVFSCDLVVVFTFRRLPFPFSPMGTGQCGPSKQQDIAWEVA